MKNLLIATAFFTVPMVNTVVAQDSAILKRQIAEQNRQISALERQVDSLQSQINLAHNRSGGVKQTLGPAAPSTSVYTVVKGDTFSSIAKRQGIKVSSLIAANPNVTPSKMAIGHKLNLPGSNAVAKKSSSSSSSVKASSNGSHVVSKGDTFYSIAKANNISVSALQAANPSVQPSKLRIGARLNLSKSSAVASKAPARKSTPTTTAKAAPKRSYEKLPEVKQQKATVSKPAPAPKSSNTSVSSNSPVARAVAVSSIMTYGEFAKRNGTTTSVLNALNGLDLPADEPMAVGSELFVPNK